MMDALQTFLRIHWTKLTWGLYEWFSSAKLVTVTLVVFIIVAFFISRSHYRRRLVALGMAMLAAYWLVVSPLFSVPATYLLTRFVPPDNGQSADAVVVLARPTEARGDRYEAALAMIEAGRSDRLLVTGGSSIAMDMIETMDERQLSPSILTGVTCVRTTQHEAEATASTLGSQGINRIILVTDAPHMLRAWLTFRGYGLSVIPHMVPIADWVAHHERSFLAIREYVGLVSYALLGRFENPPPEAFPEIVAVANQHFPLDACFKTAEQLRPQNSSQSSALP